MTITVSTTRYFGKCMNRSCKYRNVRDMTRNEMAYASNDHCPQCRCLMSYTPLKATYSAEKACTSRCMASTGPSCSCSCGGENHGSAHL